MIGTVRDPISVDNNWLYTLKTSLKFVLSDLILVNDDGDVVIEDEPINFAASAIQSESTRTPRKIVWIFKIANIFKFTKLVPMHMPLVMPTLSMEKHTADSAFLLI
ncbi:hypothetical protein OCU04_000650 [Sclerotinia nivalis]|uniref:Uncharacterized protein n=1 Tax=Sclerotinia nivalis TaxID=352851 RepID=A0A9X0AWJ1_9HELO|nr:hypothetical protein OCU04_000650 [Sclerotinia nivalis]